MTRVMLLAAVTFILTGCGGGTPPQATDPEALRQEQLKGQEIRKNLEGVKSSPPKAG